MRTGDGQRDPEALHSKHGRAKGKVREGVPKEWQAIIPRRTKYRIVTEKRDSFPGGVQSFLFEYGPEGHAKPLILKNAIVQAEVGFTCQIVNPYKAMFSANQYALNVLQPRFLVQARNTLEAYSLSELRERRLEASLAIVVTMAPQFEELGFRLESVTTGAIEQVGSN
jgi:hypothetical protein